MTILRLWFRLGTQSRRAIKKERDRAGNPYNYQPRGDLLARLAREEGQPIEEIRDQLMRERVELTRDRF